MINRLLRLLLSGLVRWAGSLWGSGLTVCAHDFLFPSNTRFEVAGEAYKMIAVIENQAHTLLLALTATRLHAIEVIPAISVKSIGNQGAPHDKPYLSSGHSWAKLVYHVLRDNVALLDINFVDPRKRTSGERGEAQKGKPGQR